MPSIDSVSFPKQYQVAPQAKAGSITSTAQMSPGAEIAQICFDLRMGLPKYVMKNEPVRSALWSGYAHFPSSPLIDGPVGEFRNVFGKNNAKRDCQAEVLKFLKDIKRDKESGAIDGANGCRESAIMEGAEVHKEVTAVKAWSSSFKSWIHREAN